MSGYGYGPPPPPPSSSGYASHPSASYTHKGPHRGGGGFSSSRGRGGQYPRPRDHHGPPQAQFEYPGQPYPPHQPHHQASYGGAHAPAGSYPPHPPQWPGEHGAHAPHGTHPHAPAPLSASNYHPGYGPQAYPAAAQHVQPPSYGSAQPYAQPYQGHPVQTASHWTPQGPLQPSQYSNSRGRGGYGDRGISKPHVGGHVRHGYEHEPVPPAVAPYGQSYPHDPRAPHFPPVSFVYPGPPPASSSSRHDGHTGHHSRRGRGGGHKDGLRGRGGHHNNPHHNKNRAGKQHSNDNKPKPDAPSVGKKKKRKVNTLGLTPGVESESEDDEGEEKILTDLIGAETLQISDVAAFLAERRKNYPTKSRVEAKKAAEMAQKDQAKTAELEKQADKLRKQLRKVEFSIKRKREQGDEGDEMRDPSEDSDDEKPEVASSRVQTAPPQPPAKKADISRHCKYYSTGGTCGKKGKCRFVHDPEVREAAIKEREANNGRLTIQQRLILNDKDQEDLAVLQSIKYLRQKGMMASTSNEADEKGGNEEKGTGPDDDTDNNQTTDAAPVPAASRSSLLPAAPASLPTPPVKRKASTPHQNSTQPSSLPSADSASDSGVKHYEGWLLQPYGSSNGDKSKADDLP
ncbi:uncharacterized protein MAM_01410 [Metarhizium album ARSEF 1941]|uniref:C3H1-type domain-containing protein n=1 Tax=Metarhizium album (strain ARSEF 1941) TaxID=1081103 RepID=A0A0B2WWN0_METAS|nr:uncharacterized protein MAM_01410 [Metarhizium album ARSEF 1941]KHO00632.1 hypothetical protein MAM_01410 [Metarhizium album ARSEF 1941]